MAVFTRERASRTTRPADGTVRRVGNALLIRLDVPTEKRLGINAYIYQDESGAYCAEVPALSGCFSCGETFEEASANIRDAAELWLECADHEPEDVPQGTKIERVVI